MVRLFFSERLCHFSNVLYAGSKREMSEMLVRIEDEDDPAHNASSPAKEDDDNPHDARIPAKTPTSKGSDQVKNTIHNGMWIASLHVDRLLIAMRSWNHTHLCLSCAVEQRQYCLDYVDLNCTLVTINIDQK